MTATEPVRLSSPTADVQDYSEWDELVESRGWGDGLPLAPPLDSKVGEIIDHLQRSPDEDLGLVAPANGRATVEQVAIQSAMAGCRPEYVPVVIAALEAILDPAFNLGGVQATTNPCAPLTIVCGPVVEALDFNVRDGAFGGGGRANVAIGRAVRLIMWNIGLGRPNHTDKSPLGQPAKFSFCVGENLAHTPWTSLSTDFGIGPDESSVVTFACQSPYPAALVGSAERMLALLAESMPVTGLLQFHAAGQFLVVLTPRVAHTLAEAGYSREDVRDHLFEHAVYGLGDLRRRGILGAPDQPDDPVCNYWGSEVLDAVRPDLSELPDDASLPLFTQPTDLHVMVTGGDGQFFGGLCPGWGGYGGFAVARRIAPAA